MFTDWLSPKFGIAGDVRYDAGTTPVLPAGQATNPPVQTRPLASQFILLTLTTSIASAIAAYELTSVAQRIESDSFRSFEVYGTVTLLYLAISTLMLFGFSRIASRLFSYPVK